MLGSIRSLLAFWLLASVLGAAEPAAAVSELPAKSCKATGPFLKSASGHAKPTHWCSSYLGITTPTQTRTITRTRKSTTTLTITQGSITVTDPINTITAPVVTETLTNTVTADTSTIIVTTCGTPKRKAKRINAAAVETGAAGPAPNRDVAATKSYPPAPSWLPNWPTSRIVTVCKCLCVETPAPVQTTTVTTVTPTVRTTTTVQSTITETATVTSTDTTTTTFTRTPSTTSEYCPPTVPPTCGNQGMQWAYFYNPWGNNGDSTYSQYDPEYMKDTTPDVNGVAISAGGFSGVCQGTGDTLDFYGNQEPCQLFSLNYRGYLYAPQSGDFTIELKQADDICLIWAGDKAYGGGYTRANSDIANTYSTVGSGVVFTVNLNAGDYTPLRFVLAQGYGPFAFDITITAPDGTVVLSSGSSGSDYLQQYPCDPAFGLPYPAWGSEDNPT